MTRFLQSAVACGAVALTLPTIINPHVLLIAAVGVLLVALLADPAVAGSGKRAGVGR